MTQHTFKEKKSNNFKHILTNSALYIVVLVMILFTGFTRSNFFTIGNATNILSNTAVRFIIALGISGTLITKGTDLSAGRIVGLSAIVAATLVQQPDFIGRIYPNFPNLPIIAVFLIVILISCFVGLLNGLVIAFLRVPPFLATLGMQIIIYGVNMLYSQNKPIGTFKKDFIQIGQGRFLNLHYVVWIAAIIGAIMWMLYKKTRYGKYMYAIGGNEQAAEVSGVNVKKSKLKIYALAGLLYGVAGFLLAAKTGSVGPGTGQGYELEAIASATIGGVSTAGGQGSVPGILLGVFIFELLKVCLSYLGQSAEFTNVVQGIVIIVAVALDIQKTRARK